MSTTVGVTNVVGKNSPESLTSVPIIELLDVLSVEYSAKQIPPELVRLSLTFFVLLVLAAALPRYHNNSGFVESMEPSGFTQNGYLVVPPDESWVLINIQP